MSTQQPLVPAWLQQLRITAVDPGPSQSPPSFIPYPWNLLSSRHRRRSPTPRAECRTVRHSRTEALNSVGRREDHETEESPVQTRFPMLRFQGPVHYLTSEKEVEMWCSCMTEGMTVGFDTEWRPTYEKDVPPRKTALIQFCFEHVDSIVSKCPVAPSCHFNASHVDLFADPRPCVGIQSIPESCPRESSHYQNWNGGTGRRVEIETRLRSGSQRNCGFGTSPAQKGPQSLRKSHVSLHQE